MKSIALLSLVLFSQISFSQTIDFVYTNPVCKQYGDKPKNAFCTREDLPFVIKNANGPLQKVLNLINDKANEKITLATMSFSHKAVASALCEAIKRHVDVTVLVDAGVELATANEMQNCGAEVFKVGTAEVEDKRGDLHHNKFLLVEQKNNKTVLVTATGNFSNPALSINHESWGFYQDDSNSELMADHRCLVDSIKKYTGDMPGFKNDLKDCRLNQKGLKKSSVESLFVPADSAKLLKFIDEQFKKSKQVLMASNRYSYDKITKSFRTEKGQDNRTLFDDDLYWGGVQPTEDYVLEAQDAQKIKGLEAKGVQVKYMQTSFGAAQKMHNKFIVFDDVVVIGAGNYTYAGMTSNFENFYIIRDAKIVNQFKQQFEYLWGLGSYKNQMPKTYWDPAATPN